MTSVTDKLKTILKEELQVDQSVAEIADDVPLMADGLELDSIALITYIEAIETRLDMQFDDTDLRPETFESLRTLSAAVSARMTN